MRRVLWVVLVVVVVGAGYLYWTTTQITPGPGLAARPECGHDWPEEVKIPLIEPIADIPEFHDCQRFIVKDGDQLKYGPLAAIFASAQLPNLERQLSLPLGTPGSGGDSLAASGGNVPGTPTVLNVPRDSRAVAIGVVYSDGAYEPLGIQPLLNCLYIYWNSAGGPDTTWTARMIPEGSAKQCPVQPADGVKPFTALEVKRAVVDDIKPGVKFTADEDYPPVARWDWDSGRSQQYISIECGIAWCEIGAPGFTPSPPLPVENSDARPEQRRVKLIKGWHDQQSLAYFDEVGALIPTGIVGTIVPHPDLGKVTNMSGWVHVADVSLASSSPADNDALKAYEKKFAFKKTPPGKPSRISIRNPGTSQQDEQFWVAEINPPGFSFTKTKKVMYRKLAATYDVPGVVRWRWMTLDEGTWARCPFGCCEISYY